MIWALYIVSWAILLAVFIHEVLQVADNLGDALDLVLDISLKRTLIFTTLAPLFALSLLDCVWRVFIEKLDEFLAWLVM